jgi:DNA polymerase type B, organellar and viral
VIKGYNFNQIHNVFNNYVHDLFHIKTSETGSLKIVAKSLLNNLFGRFGLNIFKPITKAVNKEQRDFIASTQKIISQKVINANNFLITYIPIISKIICQEHGLDYNKVLDTYHANIEKNIGIFKDISITTSALVTSYARIYMNQIKLDILKNGGQIYYTDTDSLVIDKKYINNS